MKLTFNRTQSIVLLATFIGCSSSLPINEIPQTANVVQELNSFKADMAQAQSKQLDVLSPENFEEAQSLMASASKNLNNQDSPKSVLHQISKGRSYLEQANKTGALATQSMPEVVKGRQLALAIGAQGFYPKEFETADKTLRNVSKDLENGNSKGVTWARDKLQADFAMLEVRAIKQVNLGRAQANIEQAKKADAKKYAPQSLAIAERDHTNAEAYITANPHEESEIRKRSELANQSADHLLKIASSARNTTNASSEETALQLESAQLNSAKKQADLTREKGVTQALSAENDSLSSERNFNLKFEQAQATFKPTEAEVYKKGDSLVIRLRGLEFESSRSELTEKSFALLAKVQAVLKEFDPSTVVVEGHTDSAGGKAANEKLSTSRATIVRDYLIANNSAWTDKIKAIGMGYQKPLATNKTSEGRAQNRRVDVVIVPDKQKL